MSIPADERFRETEQCESIADAMSKFSLAMEQGYLRGKLFQVISDGSNPDAVKAFLAGPFAEMRSPFSRWLANAIARFPDSVETEALAHNLNDEFGEAKGRPSHATLYRRVLDELGVAVKDGSVSTPEVSTSAAAQTLKNFCECAVESESLQYLLGFFAGFEATDGPDFERLGAAVRSMWPERSDLHEFFTTHAASQHGTTFIANLNPSFLANKPEYLRGMRDFLRAWETFYEESATEVGL